MIKNKENNLVQATYGELKSLGFEQPPEQLDKKGIFIPPPVGSFLCLVNKDRDLWAELSDSDIKSAKLTVEKSKYLIMSKL